MSERLTLYLPVLFEGEKVEVLAAIRVNEEDVILFHNRSFRETQDKCFIIYISERLKRANKTTERQNARAEASQE